MASIFELGDIPGGLLPGVCTLAAVTDTATLTAAQSYNVIVRGVPTATATYTTATASANDKIYRHPTFYELPDEVKYM
jgi:1,2-phenylacetyl-CoA epoxidase PaaB subunit